MTNRELVTSLISTDEKGTSIDELVEKTGFDRWKILACVWLSAAKLKVVHTDDPMEVRWRRVS